MSPSIGTSSSEQNESGAQRFQDHPLRPGSAHRAHLAAQAENSREQLRASERARFWFAVKVALLCAGWCVLGFLPMAWALHSTDEAGARMWWRLGPVIGQSLVILTLIVAAHKWEQDHW